MDVGHWERSARARAMHRSGLRFLACACCLAAASAKPLARAALLQELPDTEAAFTALEEAKGLRAGGAFPFDYQQLAFRAPDGRTVVWAAASVHAGRVRGVFEAGWKYSLGISVEYFRGDSLVAADSTHSDFLLNVQIPESISDGFPVQTSVRLEPGDYEYRMRVQDHNWEANRSVNEKTGSVTVPGFDTSGPVVSSIAVAADTGGTWTPAPGVTLKLNAAGIVYRSARPFIFFEVYGMTPGGDYRGEVRLVSRWASTGKGETFTSPFQPFQLQYRGTAPLDPAEPVRGVFRLEMDNTQEGPYEVRVRVTDLTTGAVSATRAATLKVREHDRTRPTVPISEVSPGAGAGGRP